MIAISIGDAPDAAARIPAARGRSRSALGVHGAGARRRPHRVWREISTPPVSPSRSSVICPRPMRFAGRPPPFVHVVPEPVLRRANFADLAAMLKEARGTVETRIAFADERVVRLIAEDDDGPRGDDQSNRYAIRAVDPTSPSGTLINSAQSLEHWLGDRAAEAFEMRRRGVTRGAQDAGLKYPTRIGLVIEQAYELVGLVFADGVNAQIGAHEIAALQVDLHVEHVGAHVDEIRTRRLRCRVGVVVVVVRGAWATRAGRLERRQRVFSGRCGSCSRRCSRKDSRRPRSRSSTSCTRATAALRT